MLEEALPDLKERTGVDQIHTDGGYGSPDMDKAMRKAKVGQIQTAIRGRKPSEEKLGLDLRFRLGDRQGRQARAGYMSPRAKRGSRRCQGERSIAIWPTLIALFVVIAPWSINVQQNLSSASQSMFCVSLREKQTLPYGANEVRMCVLRGRTFEQAPNPWCDR